MVVEAGLAGSTTRVGSVSADNAFDYWSYRSFVAGDKIGMFSPHGNFDDDDGRGPFINEWLEFEGGTNFRHNGIKVAPSHMDPQSIYLYMPYGGNATDTKIELRTTEIPSRIDNSDGVNYREMLEEGVERCIDFLEAAGIGSQAEGNTMKLTGTFAHMFSELIIMRGKGFDHPMEGRESITAVLSDGYSHIKVSYNLEPWSCRPELIYDDGKTDDGDTADGDTADGSGYSKSKQECTRWTAWKGMNFGITEEDTEGVEAWYVILPTLRDNMTTVECIEIYDNDGQLQKVTALKLHENTKRLNPAHRYPFEITMEELVPTVNPFPITPWGGETVITNERQRGIENITDFARWVEEYNKYIADKNNEAELLKYGDIVEYENGERGWHFYLLNDLDLGDYKSHADGTGTEYDVIIPELHDILDGVSTELSDHRYLNHTLKNLKKPLVDKLSGRGALQNMDLERPSIHIIKADDKPVGILACTVEGGTISNCNIENGTLISTGPVGMIAGEVKENSRVTDCRATGGFMVGSQSYEPYDYLFGLQPAGSISNNTGVVNFEPTE